MQARLRQWTAVCLVSILLLPGGTYAAIMDYFNPDYLLTDEELQDAGSMTQADIQAFLTEKGSALKDMVLPDLDGVSRSVAEMIHRAADTHQINPKYLLVKLQKEQSLLTEPSPLQKQLDWAAGYGVCDACRLDDPAIQKFKGFGIQVDSAAAIMRWYFDHAAAEPWIKQPLYEYDIDGTRVVPQTFATAFLYTYTPHLHGNRNFWTLWQNWFQARYPNGTLLKSAQGPTVYAVRDGKKHPIQNMTALVTRYDPKLILTVPESELNRYETGSTISFPNYAVLRVASDYYLVDDDRIRPFANETVVRALGYNPQEIIEATTDDIASMAVGAPIAAGQNRSADVRGRLVKLAESGRLYFIKDGNYHPIYHPVIAAVNFPALPIEPGHVEDIETLKKGEPIRLKDGTLIGVKAFNSIYVIENGKKRRFASEEVFTDLGYTWEHIMWLPALTTDSYQSGLPMYLHREESLGDEPPEGTATSTMFAVPESESVYAGERIDTPVNTYLIADGKTGEVLAGKNIDVVRPMASFAKVMTAYRLYKERLNENRLVTYNPKTHRAAYDRYRPASGEQVKNKDLLSAMLISSLNTPARMLVSSVDKNEAAFVNRMNAQAKTWGLAKTKFIDPAGTHDDNTTTAREYLTMFKHALSDPHIKKFLSAESYSYTEAKDRDGKPGHFDANTNKLMQDDSLPFRILASKTGYLEKAGFGLAMLIERPSDKRTFFVLTMGNPQYQNRFDEPRRIAIWTVDRL